MMEATQLHQNGEVRWMRSIIARLVVGSLLAVGGLFGQLSPQHSAVVDAASPGQQSIPVHSRGRFALKDLKDLKHGAATTSRHAMPRLRLNAGARPQPGGLPPTAPRAAAGARPRVAATPPFAVQTDFAGLSQADDTGVFGPGIEPPDPWVAVGPVDVLQSVNSLLRLTDRSGTQKAIGRVDDFFGVLPGQVVVSDPRLVYDQQHDRWIGTVMSFDCTNGYLYLAVSETSDPAGFWDGWFFTYNGSIPDFPGLGSSSDKIVISANEFAIDPTSADCTSTTSPRSSLLVVDWSAVQGTAPIRDAYFSTPGYWSWRPAPNLSPDPAIYVVGERRSDGDVTYAKLTGDVRNPNAPGPDPSPVQFVGPTDINSIAAFAPPPPPAEPGSPNTIADAVDERPTDAVWANGSLWFVSTFPQVLTGDPAPRDTVRVTQILTAGSPTVRQDFTIGTAGVDTFMGGIGLTANGTAYFVYSTSSTTTAVSTWANLQHPDDPVNTFSDPVLVASGSGNYPGTRWGDFVGVAQDPAYPDAVWAADEVPVAGAWTTRVTQLATSLATPTGSTYHALTPARLLDTRIGNGLAGPFVSHVARTFQVTGRGGVPGNATAVTGNLTVVGQTAPGYLFLGPVATNNPTSSTLNFPLGDARANGVTVALGASGTLSATYVAGTLSPHTQVLFDVTGYFTP